MSSSEITVAFSSHRLETIPRAAALMGNQDLIILEEPSTTGFWDMLNGEISISDYFLEAEPAFPEFSSRTYEVLRGLHNRGVSILQMEPYLEELVHIHDFFGRGGKPQQLKKDTLRLEIYRMERCWTGALVNFYTKAGSRSPFHEIVASVHHFARADATRGRFRDELRVKAILAVIPSGAKSYVEAGYIHLWLLRKLRQGIGALNLDYQVKPIWLTEPFTRELIGRRQILGPGDHLTLLYTLRPEKPVTNRSNLLAARSLIYVKLLKKEEISSSTSTEGASEGATERMPTPHILDEYRCLRLVERLSYSDCEALYPKVRELEPSAARKVVEKRVGRK